MATIFLEKDSSQQEPLEKIPLEKEGDGITEQEVARQPSIVIVGAGATGILACIKLWEWGVRDIVLLEKADRIGGTWRENTYPGIACDVPAHHYCYSFAPHAWRHVMAHGGDIQAYLEKISRDYGVDEAVRLNESAVSSHLQDDGRWLVKTSKGASLAADFVISASGVLHRPKWPDIPGMDSFEGASWHTAEWRHDVELGGKRIGVIGTGSTAHQAIPELINAGHDVRVFQRTAQWVYPFPNAEFPEKWVQAWRRNPRGGRILKKLFQFNMEQFFVKATIGQPVQNFILNIACRLNLRLSVRDSELRARLTPDYGVGCKRMVVNTTFYDAIQKENASLVTEPIAAIEKEGIRLESGELVELDVLIYATGFHNFDFMRPMELIGREGHSIDGIWGEGRYPIYNAMLLEHFPNYILMLGPGTPIGNNSVIAMAEAQMAYVAKLLEMWRAGQRRHFEPTAAATESYMAWLKKGLEKTVWVRGCQSWYLDKDGVPMVFPYSWKTFLRSLDEVDETAFK